MAKRKRSLTPKRLVTFEMTEDEIERLDVLAEQHDRSRSSMIRVAVADRYTSDVPPELKIEAIVPRG